MVRQPEEPPSVEEVREAQAELRERGLYLGAVDGELHAETRIALARFQRMEGLEVTGALDAGTREALGRRGREPGPAAPEAPSKIPSAAELLETAEELPQPPSEALDPLLEEVRHELAEAAREADVILQEPDGAPAEVRLSQAEKVLEDARRRGFDRILAFRKEGGWALLPEVLATELRDALGRRHLLLRPDRSGWGRDESSAIRWMERSLQLPQKGEPSLDLLEALGIDPSPMFQP